VNRFPLPLTPSHQGMGNIGRRDYFKVLGEGALSV
jgi:hypothetical protein